MSTSDTEADSRSLDARISSSEVTTNHSRSWGISGTNWPSTLMMTDETLQLISLLERLHRRVLHTIKVELEALGVLDISNVQAIMLLQIADAEVTIGELALRGFNLLSNVSYNVKRMVANGYLMQKRSKHDRRVILVRPTQKSRSLCRQIRKIHHEQVKMLQKRTFNKKEVQQLIVSLMKLDSFWISAAELMGRTSMR